MASNLSFSVLTANMISLLLLGTLYFGNKQRMVSDRNMRMMMRIRIAYSSQWGRRKVAQHGPAGTLKKPENTVPDRR